MQGIKYKLRSSFFNLLAGHISTAPSTAQTRKRTEDIRACMLAALGEAGARRFPYLVVRIGNALDASGLWYLRSSLMQALSQLNGEMRAREHIAGLSSLFEGLLPQSLGARTSPLEHDLRHRIA